MRSEILARMIIRTYSLSAMSAEQFHRRGYLVRGRMRRKLQVQKSSRAAPSVMETPTFRSPPSAFPDRQQTMLDSKLAFLLVLLPACLALSAADYFIRDLPGLSWPDNSLKMHSG